MLAEGLHGASRWKKLKGMAMVRLPNDTIYVSSLNFMVKFYDIDEHYYNLLFLLILKI